MLNKVNIEKSAKYLKPENYLSSMKVKREMTFEEIKRE